MRLLKSRSTDTCMWASTRVYHNQNSVQGIFPTLKHKALPGFPLYFQVPYLSEETCFHQGGSSAVEGTSQAGLGSSDQWKVSARLSLF
jgi:hypothetical protein